MTANEMRAALAQARPTQPKASTGSAAQWLAAKLGAIPVAAQSFTDTVAVSYQYHNAVRLGEIDLSVKAPYASSSRSC